MFQIYVKHEKKDGKAAPSGVSDDRATASTSIDSCREAPAPNESPVPTSVPTSRADSPLSSDNCAGVTGTVSDPTVGDVSPDSVDFTGTGCDSRITSTPSKVIAAPPRIRAQKPRVSGCDSSKFLSVKKKLVDESVVGSEEEMSDTEGCGSRKSRGYDASYSEILNPLANIMLESNCSIQPTNDDSELRGYSDSEASVSVEEAAVDTLERLNAQDQDSGEHDVVELVEQGENSALEFESLRSSI